MVRVGWLAEIEYCWAGFELLKGFEAGSERKESMAFVFIGRKSSKS